MNNKITHLYYIYLNLKFDKTIIKFSLFISCFDDNFLSPFKLYILILSFYYYLYTKIKFKKTNVYMSLDVTTVPTTKLSTVL